MSTKKTRRKFTPEEKVSILKRHFLEKVHVSDLCDELNMNPNVFYRWQKEFFERGILAFQRNNDNKIKKYEEENNDLKSTLRRKNDVLAELMEDHVKLKKSLGED